MSVVLVLQIVQWHAGSAYTARPGRECWFLKWQRNLRIWCRSGPAKSAGGAKPSIKNHRKSLQTLQSANIEGAACSDPQCGMLLHAKKMQQEAQQTARGQRHVDCGCACLLGLVQANRGCGKVLKAAKLMLADCFGKLCGGSSLGKRHSGSQAIRP